ncbi:MAG: phosphoribosylamine--glycine ligase [Chloroflexi bacterium]|nr:phosphoribosylamine--glycine ligase [Chloroflexota bacterium]
MKVLVIGSGAREHALAWKLSKSPRVKAVYAAPGNAGTALLGENLPVAGEDLRGLSDAVQAKHIDLVVVGPEGPLAAGAVDHFRKLGVPVFGPSQKAAQLESSKAFAKGIMRKYGIPCARGETFESFDAAKKFVEAAPKPPVVKADGLAAGKGVMVPATKQEAIAALQDAMVKGIFGPAGKRVVLEECLDGVEASVFAFSDGEHVMTTIPACDYKRVNDGDQGPNTVGMGSYSPPEFLSDDMIKRIHERVMVATVRAMASEGIPYTGVLYAGLMVSKDDFKVIEFNSRLGDPETQVILPRLESDLLDVIEAVIAGRLDRVSMKWTSQPCVGVVMASGGYPGNYVKGKPISGLDDVDDDVQVFHAGTKLQGGVPVTDGGRVLTVSAIGKDMRGAMAKAYDNVRRIRFEGAHYRKDIALRVVQR